MFFSAWGAQKIAELCVARGISNQAATMLKLPGIILNLSKLLIN